MINIDWSKIPNLPGVYIWKNSHGEVLYVGKAKKLKNRMQSYFRNNINPKNKIMFNQICDFDIQVSDSEINALLLEETLINKYEPKYNIKIKSSKRYPYIKLIKKDEIKLETSISLKNEKNAVYFGPFPDGFSARRIIKILKNSFPLDGCLDPKSGKKCINYQMGRCMGKCIGEINENEINFILNQIKDFFKGNTDYVKNRLKKSIDLNSKLLNFEVAQKKLEDIKLIEKLNNEKTLAFKDSKHRDIINFYRSNGVISISIMYIRFGGVNITNNFLFKDFDNDSNEIIESFIKEYYKNNLKPDELIIPFKLEWKNDLDFKLNIPKSGKRKDLLDLVYINSKQAYKNHYLSFINKQDVYEDTIKFINKNITKNKISEIEMVDISSTMGSNQVGAVVRFKNGEPYKEGYRKFIIKSTEKMDDYASTEEVVKRHFLRIIKDKRKLPDLFIVDGKYQLSMAKKILSILNINDVTLIGLIKDENHKTNAIINEDLVIIDLDKKSKPYLFFSRIQEEVHRFVISFHRKKRNETIIESKLDKYKFLNELDKANLFKEFKSIRKILTANPTDLRRVLTKSKTEKLLKEIENG